MSEATNTAPHLLSLKVMRLSRPSFVQVNPIPFEPAPTLPGNAALTQAAENDITSLSEPVQPPIADLLNLNSPVLPLSNLNIRDFGLSDLLTVPSSFGNIYLGETFSSYLCVNNESGSAVQDVGIKAELQTGSQRFTLADTLGGATPRASVTSVASSNSADTSFSSSLATRVPLLPTQQAEFVIHHEIKELGVHILVCSVHYSTSGGERRFFRKFYKFQVLNPLAVKTKVNSLQDGRVFLEAQVQNVANETMYLDKMRFEANELFQFHDLNTIITVSDSAAGDGPRGIKARPVVGATEDGAVYLSPQDTRQYLYMLQPRKPQDSVARTTPTLGKLDIMWRTHLGETGRLQTAQLSRKVPPIEPYNVAVIATPDRIHAERPFSVTCRIRNNLVSETLRLSIHGVKSKMSSVLLMGPSERYFGNIGPLEHVDFELDFFPLLAGLHKISGFRLNEMVSGTSRDVDNLVDVHVWQTA
ncbi:hypothetical protein SpCBS45565_g07661 [Spizellomyces sp. 'palustris']|nr:hypothetical protein SpCBS45565_g07661 [Spizellomyces sp. 'palustris']